MPLNNLVLSMACKQVYDRLPVIRLALPVQSLILFLTYAINVLYYNLSI